MNINVDIKKLRRIVEDCLMTVGEHSRKHQTTFKIIDQMNTSVVRELKNTGHENSLLDRELNRMQHIDRVKVTQARNSFYNPDTGNLFPTLESMFAAAGPTSCTSQD